jgi:DNA ligase-1
LLAHSFEDVDVDPTGWWLSEKLDGVRGYWDGKNFISRQGNVFHAPDWFKMRLPDHPLDGELWMGRKLFQKTISVVKRLDAGEQWKKIMYVVFDAPHLDKPFEERMQFLDDYARREKPPYMQVHSQWKVQSRKYLLDELKRFEAMGAEGLMIRKPGSLYEVGRSSTLLKVKPFKDAEAIVVGHEPGKGRHKGRLGALVVQMPNGKTFSVGTGLSDAERENPPKIGATITYRYADLTDDSLPKCGSFLAVRDYE